jgi:two-component system LytT family sensor kinase
MRLTDASADHREYYPIRAVDVATVVGFWAFLSLVSAFGRQLDPHLPLAARGIVSAMVASAYVEYATWAVLTIPIWWMATRYSVERGNRVQRALAFAALGIVIAVIMDRFTAEVRQSFLPGALGERVRRRLPPPALGLGFLDDLMVYLAVLGSGIARDYLLRYRTRLSETVQLQAQLAQARLDSLRTQLNPHFLFNTLNAVSALVERDPRGARKMIARLSDLLRYTLDESDEQEVPLHRELDVLGEYIDLMQIRFQDKLQVQIDVGDDARGAYVPNLLLQPIVENALKHGVAELTGVGQIRIAARRSADDLVITVSDNGPGPSGPADGTGVGLRNTNARLAHLYGAAYRVTLVSADGKGAEARIVLPYHRAPVARPTPGSE